jgi:hypothetical protein
MPDDEENVKSALALPPTSAAAGGTSPDAYALWRATTLGPVTEAQEPSAASPRTRGTLEPVRGVGERGLASALPRSSCAVPVGVASGSSPLSQTTPALSRPRGTKSRC